jgi:trehalose 6-phosphate synthase
VARERRRLIVVSNRGPVSFERGEGGRRIARRGGGGLVTALRSLASDHDVTWIASAMSDEERKLVSEVGGAAMDERARDGSPYRLRLVAHPPEAYDWYYNVIANPLLWFVQHYLWELAYTPTVDRGVHHAWENGYVPVNRSFADAVVEELDAAPEAIVFFHDYHLYLAPRFVRAARPDAALAQFVHIPWPAADYWHVLSKPIRAAIHDGLLANDVVSFHTTRWRRNFLRSCEDLVGADCDYDAARATYDGRSVRVGGYPISVDVAEFDQLAQSDAVLAAERRLVRSRPEKLVVRVDRTDPSKNVVRGFRAFELYLDAHPEMHGRVAMLALLDPSRQDIPEYSEYLGAIQRAARTVNDHFQRAGWTPIDLRIEDNFAESVAAYKQFDVLFVNAIFDGLNLVAKEAPLVNERAGVVVLSENAGAHDELGDWVVTVNPFDVEGQANAIHAALQLDEGERGRRLGAIRAHVRSQTLGDWIDAQLADFERGATNRHGVAAAG